MTSFNTIALDFPEALALAELDAVRMDLEWVVDICERMIELERSHSDLQLLVGLTTSATIRYARCFPPGVRRPVPEECVKALPDDLQRAHRYFLDQRDGFFAHSVNPFEQNHATVMVPESGTRGYPPESIGFQHQMLATLGEPDVRAMQRLAQSLRDCVSKQLELEERSVLEIARQIPLEELQKRDLVAVEVVLTSEAGKARVGAKAKFRAAAR